MRHLLVRALLPSILLAGSALSAAVFPAPAAAAACRGSAQPLLTVSAVPALPGVRLALDGRDFETDARGVASIAAGCGTHTLSVRAPQRMRSGQRARFGRWDDSVFTATRTVEMYGPVELEVGFEMDYLVRESFVDLHGRAIPTSWVSTVVQSNSLGSREQFVPGRPRWLSGSRLIRRSDGLQPTSILYSVRSVVIDGTSAVRKAEQRFYPRTTRDVKIKLLLYSARIAVRDRFFGFPIGSSLSIAYPDGHERNVPLEAGARKYLDSLPRGTYHVTVQAPGLKSTVPIALTRNQDVTLRVLSYLDLGVFFGSLATAALALLLIRRPNLRARLRPRVPWRSRAASSIGLVVALCVSLFVLAPGASAGTQQRAGAPVPVLAYYYIWFTHGSWQRAKRDYPLLGRYSSDELDVMRQHVRWAKAAGIEGFIVSWKSTPVLNSRLERLARVAREEHFKLAIIYQGLDFAREPLGAERIRRDLRSFASRYRRNPVFDVFGKPLVIWSGTWRFSSYEIGSVARAVRPRVLLLASEKNLPDYTRIASLVDGDAYYWSSVNPSTYPTYAEKLTAMSAAIHERNGLWIAPAAPGFDARLVGGSSVVGRERGKTLRAEFAGALRSSPDAVGLISWNEFSENSHVEPSERNGTGSLKALADILGTKFSARTDFDSSDVPNQTFGYGIPLLIGGGLILFTVLAAGLWRRELRNAQQS